MFKTACESRDLNIHFLSLQNGFLKTAVGIGFYAKMSIQHCFKFRYVTRHDILCPNAVKRDVGKTRCKSDVILRNCTLLRNLLSGIC